ncbi:serine hydrolase [Aurantiacibacter suaedae]|uniref:serine hydrolase n=1 Tax=Aurantiacibacter suaedae TaxID=2545755 RepID=UPI0013873891|nr:serine hydrolase [Aurantiacibacter suaedae]
MTIPALRWFASLCAAALLTFAPSASAQTGKRAEGLWSGVLTISSSLSLRIVVEITRQADGSLAGTLDSPDQDSFGAPLAAIEASDTALAFTLPVAGASYAATWSSEADGWLGTFTQGAQSWPLTLRQLDPEQRPQRSALPAEWQIPATDVLTPLLARRIAARPGAGFVLGISENGARRIVTAGPEGSPEFDGDTVFEIGSITKVFTALLLADMTLKGEVALDDPVETYLPAGARMPRGASGTEITLRHLSLQTSGLPRLPDNMPYGDPADPYADYTEAMLLDFLANFELPREVGAHYEYSNLGVGLLGYALARAAGTDYVNLVRERILDPLGMDDTAIALNADMQAHFAVPHDEYLRAAKPWNMSVLVGAGGLRSTASDMLTFAEAAMDPASPIGEAMALTLSERTDQITTDYQTALGWFILPAPGGEVLNHSGGTGGFRSHLAVQPAARRAVVSLTNAAAEPSAPDLAFHALLGTPVVPEADIPPAPEPAPEREEMSLSREQLAPLVGTYRMANNARLIITREGDQLFAQLTSQPAFPIFAEGPRAFFLKVVDARLVFTGEGETITGVTLYQNGAEVPFERID